MTMPGPSRWRGWVAAAMLLLAVAGGYALLSRDPPRVDRPPVAEPAPDSVVAQAVPQLDRVMDRASLIDAAAQAASAYSAGDALDDIEAQIAGRRFRLEMPLGCAGPAAGGAPLDNGWRLDDEGRTLRAAISRQSWTITLPSPRSGVQPAAPPAGDAPGDGSTRPPADMTVSGFWISRPWMLGADCPARDARDSMPGIERETLAIVEPGDPEARGEGARRQGYRLDVRVTPDQAPHAGEGLRVRIDGRLAASSSSPINCRTEGPGNRPTCFLIARIETVAITSASGERVHAEWRD